MVYIGIFILENVCFYYFGTLSLRFPYRYLHPIYYGDYPEVMRNNLGDQLPKFMQKDKELVRNSLDFVGLNHYTSRFIAHATKSPEEGSFYEAQEMERLGITVASYLLSFHGKFNIFLINFLLLISRMGRRRGNR